MDEIYERLDSIINRDKLMTLTVFNESGDMIYTETKKAEEYHRKNFKKKYNFVSDKDGSSRGTITVDGKKYNVDLSRTPDTYHKSDADNGENLIKIGREIFKVGGKNGSRQREAALQHEIGHQNLHSLTDPDSNMVEDDISRAEKHTEFGKKKLEQIRNRSEKETSNRKMTRSYAQKYDKSRIVSHANPKEFEADRYAANRTSEKDMLGVLSQLYNQQLKDAGNAQSKKDDGMISMVRGKINSNKESASKFRMMIKKLSLRMNHLDRHPDEDPDHKERDKLKKQISTLSSFIDRRSSDNKELKNRIQDFKEINKSTMNKLKDRANVDFHARSEAMKDENLRSDPVLKKNDKNPSNKK